jgi:hypothetical protein
MLVKNPGVTAAAVLSLAIGIGANTTVFSWIQGLFLRPFPKAPRIETIKETLEWLDRYLGPVDVKR